MSEIGLHVKYTIIVDERSGQLAIMISKFVENIKSTYHELAESQLTATLHANLQVRA